MNSKRERARLLTALQADLIDGLRHLGYVHLSHSSDIEIGNLPVVLVNRERVERLIRDVIAEAR